jgi:VCBS repeat-containing protein
MLNAVLALNELDTSVFGSPEPGAAPRVYDDHVTVPDAHLLFNGEFKRVGSNDLKIVGEGGQSFFIADYFAAEKRANLMSPDGATLSAHVVEALAGPLAPGQHAQAGGQAASAQPVIGRVDALSGSATVVRNGVTVALNVGDTVRKGDVVQTSGGSAVAIVFADGTTFSLNANARMVLNDFVYAAGGAGNSASISLVQGAFSFVAGQLAKTGDLRVETPVATMGIRGTAVLVEISANDGQTRFSVMVEPDGTTGSFNLYNKTTGALIATVNNSQVGWVVTPAGPLQVVAQQVQKTPGELAQELGIVQQIFTIFNNNQQNPFVPTQDRGDNNSNDSNTKTADGSGSSGEPLTVTVPVTTPGNPTPTNVVVTVTPVGTTSVITPTDTTPAPDVTPPATTPTPASTPSINIIDYSNYVPPVPQINGNSGADYIIGSNYDDIIDAGTGNDFVFSGLGNDTLIAGHGGGNDYYDGGDGFDALTFASADGVIFDLNFKTVSGVKQSKAVSVSQDPEHNSGTDIFVNVEKIVASPGNDIFILRDLVEWEIDAGAGIDIVRLANGVDFLNTPGGPDITNFEIVDLLTDQTVDQSGKSNVVHFDVADLGQNGTLIDGHKVIRILGNDNDIVSIGNRFGFEGTWTKSSKTVSSDSVFLTDDLTDGIEFDVYTWTFGDKTETVYVQHGIVINTLPVYNLPIVNVFGNYTLTELQGVEAIKLTSGAIGQDALEEDLGLPSTTFEDLAEAANEVYPPNQNTAPDGPTSGSAVSFGYYLREGESFHTSWLFDANDYLPYNDFAFVAITLDGEVVQTIDLLSSIDVVGNYNATAWQQFSFNVETEGFYSFSFGVMDEGDYNLSSDLYVAQPHITLAPLTEDVYCLPDEGGEGEDPVPTLSITRTIRFTDPDENQIFSATAEFVNGDPRGTVEAEVIEGEGGPEIILHYSVENAAVQYLAEGQYLFEDIKVILFDGIDYAEQYFTVAIVGTNDAPEITVAEGDSAGATLTETGSGLSAEGTLTALDVDQSDQLTFSVVSLDADGPLGQMTEQQIFGFMSVSPHGNDGQFNWVFNSGPNTFSHLAAGEMLILHFELGVSDGTATATQFVNIAIEGANNAPVIHIEDAGTYDNWSDGESPESTTLYGLTVTDDDASECEIFHVTVTADYGTLSPVDLRLTEADQDPDPQSLSFYATLTDINNALEQGVVYTDPSSNPKGGLETVTLTVTDADNNSDSINFIFNVFDEPNVDLTGTDGKDVLFSTGHNDTFEGGAGADTFVFGTEGGLGSGQDTITDFTQGQDRIALYGYAEADLTITLVDNGNNTQISFGEGNTITLSGAIALNPTDFIFHPSNVLVA